MENYKDEKPSMSMEPETNTRENKFKDKLRGLNLYFKKQPIMFVTGIFLFLYFSATALVFFSSQGKEKEIEYKTNELDYKINELDSKINELDSKIDELEFQLQML